MRLLSLNLCCIARRDTSLFQSSLVVSCLFCCRFKQQGLKEAIPSAAKLLLLLLLLQAPLVLPCRLWFVCLVYAPGLLLQLQGQEEKQPQQQQQLLLLWRPFFLSV